MKYELLSGCLRVGYWEAPEMTLNEEKAREFDSIFAAMGRASPAGDYKCEYPKHEFLTYLVEHKNVLLRGSNLTNFSCLVPIRRSTSDHS